MAELIGNGKRRSLLSHGQTNRHRLDRREMDRIGLEPAVRSHVIAQVKMQSDGFLRFQAIHHPVGVIVKRDLRPRNILKALRRFVESFIRIARARNQHARP